MRAVPLGAGCDDRVVEGAPRASAGSTAHGSMNVEADLTDGAALGDVEKALDALPIMKHMPPGVRAHKSITAEAMQDLSSGFAEAMRHGLIMVYIVLMLAVSPRVLQPITILFSLPLSIGGANRRPAHHGPSAVAAGHHWHSDADGHCDEKMPSCWSISPPARWRVACHATAAIAEAGTKRARPIVMTTIAMVAGMVPSALGLGAGGEFRSPMAIAGHRRPDRFDVPVAALRPGGLRGDG